MDDQALGWGEVDTITWHDVDGTELHRSSVIGHDVVAYTEPNLRDVYAAAWVGDRQVMRLEILTLWPDDVYQVGP